MSFFKFWNQSVTLSLFFISLLKIKCKLINHKIIRYHMNYMSAFFLFHNQNISNNFIFWFHRVKTEREKQRELARKRLAEKLEQRKKASKVTNQIPQYTEIPGPTDTESVIGWVESIIKEVEVRHLNERELLMQVRHFLPPGVACTTGLSHNPFTWRPL